MEQLSSCPVKKKKKKASSILDEATQQNKYLCTTRLKAYLRNQWAAEEVNPDHLEKKNLSYHLVEHLVSLQQGLGNFVPSGRVLIDFLCAGAWGKTSMYMVWTMEPRSETGSEPQWYSACILRMMLGSFTMYMVVNDGMMNKNHKLWINLLFIYS